MRAAIWKRMGAALIVLVLGGGGYFGWMMMPGGTLSGALTAVPAVWDGTEVPKVVRLETNPAEPYSVKIWVVPIGPHLYVHAGAHYTAWVQYLEQDPTARLLMDERLYTLRAERVTGAAEFATFADAYERRYGRRPRNENVAQVYLFRLTAG
jgi:hypothetical protein